MITRLLCHILGAGKRSDGRKPRYPRWLRFTLLKYGWVNRRVEFNGEWCYFMPRGRGR